MHYFALEFEEVMQWLYDVMELRQRGKRGPLLFKVCNCPFYFPVSNMVDLQQQKVVPPPLIKQQSPNFGWRERLCGWKWHQGFYKPKNQTHHNSPCSGNSPYAFKLRASSALYLRMTSALLSWNSRWVLLIIYHHKLDDLAYKRPTHLVIPQADQDDVWRVDPNLQNKNPSTHQAGSRSITLHFVTSTHTCTHSFRLGWVAAATWTATDWPLRNRWCDITSGGLPCVPGQKRCEGGPSGHSYLFPEFSSDVAKPLGSIKAHGLQTTVPQHFYHLSVLWKAQEGRGPSI